MSIVSYFHHTGFVVISCPSQTSLFSGVQWVDLVVHPTYVRSRRL